MENGKKPRMTEAEASKDLEANENYLRRMDYLTDGELREKMKVSIRKEKASLDKWAESGEFFILSGARKVHLPTCPSMRREMDRDAAWAPYLRDLERVRDWRGDDHSPAMPTLLKRSDVETLTKYSTCPTCAPTLDHTDKRRNPKGWTLLKAGSLKAKHFGRRFFLQSGAELGELTRLGRVETAAGLEFSAEFADRRIPLTDPEAMLQYRTPGQGEVSQQGASANV